MEVLTLSHDSWKGNGRIMHATAVAILHTTSALLVLAIQRCTSMPPKIILTLAFSMMVPTMTICCALVGDLPMPMIV